MLKANNIHKKYGHLEVLRGVDVEINQGEVVSIVGASGAGKSTLLHILGTLDRSDRGDLYFDTIHLNKLKDNDLAKFRNEKMGFVFQFHHLLPEFNALENICLPALIGGKSMKEAEQKANELAITLGLEHRLHHKPSQLSGGEQQRVAVARALINNPAVVFADEPSGNLDSATAKELHELFFKLRKDLNQTFVIVTHNEQLANMADRKLTMKDGVIVG
jgi:lipoprotein-releasing system ATP-binding protein